MSDDELLACFREAQLTLEQFTHRAHLRIAWILLERMPFADAMAELRSGLPRLLQAFGVEDSPTQGYHETTTRAFLVLVDVTRRAYQKEMEAQDSAAFCDAHPQLDSSKVLRFFYSPERRMDPRAKTEFLAPDLAPLPQFSA